jgi:hypothetical protein
MAGGGLTHMELFEGKVACGVCGRFETFARCRIMSKNRGSWKCNGCHSKEHQLRRRFGKWPLDSFAGFAEEKRVAFMVTLDGMSSAAMATECERFISSEEHQEYYQDGGEFLPLSVWAKRGFDPDRIEAKALPSDIQEHSVLGPTYRVRIISMGNRGARGIKRAHNLEATATVKRPAAVPKILAIGNGDGPEGAVPEPAPVTPVADPSPAPSRSASSGSSSPSSSSSSGHKKKKKKHSKKSKKDKKSKKEKKSKKSKKDAKPNQAESPAELKARLLVEKAKAKDLEKEHAANKKFAGILIAKLQPVVLSMQGLADKDTMDLVPEMLRTPFMDHLLLFNSHVLAATAVITAGGQGHLPIVDLKVGHVEHVFAHHHSGYPLNNIMYSGSPLHILAIRYLHIWAAGIRYTVLPSATCTSPQRLSAKLLCTAGLRYTLLPSATCTSPQRLSAKLLFSAGVRYTLYTSATILLLQRTSAKRCGCLIRIGWPLVCRTLTDGPVGVLQVLASQVAAAKKTQLLVETICATLSKGQ